MLNVSSRLVGVAVAASLALAACSPAAAPPAAAPPAGGAGQPPAAVQDPAAQRTAQLFEAAKKEGSVVVYSGDKKNQMDPLVQGFEKRYPGVKVDAGVEKPNLETRERIIAEGGAGKGSIDVWWTGFTSGLTMQQAGVIESYQSPELANLLPGMVPSGVQFNPLYGNYQTMVINTNVIPPQEDRKSTRLNSSHIQKSRMPSSA